MTASRHLHRHLQQRGAATIVVVMVLFLVMALLAAYANRSMLFEQRMASSYVRASLSQEAAEGGMEWLLSQLNGTAIDGACKPVASGGQRFVDRYLQINAADRTITPLAGNKTDTIDCASDPAQRGWACRCPDPSVDRVEATATAPGDQPPSSFVIHTLTPGTRAGTMLVRMLSCTDSVVDNCLRETLSISQAQLGRTKSSVLVGLIGAVRNPPASPLVVRGGISSSGAGLGLHNTDTRSNGMLVTYGGSWSGRIDDRLQSVPGTATNQVVTQDATLASPNVTADRLFQMYLGATASGYQRYPALRPLQCDAADCGAAIQTAYDAGQRILWVNGPMTISSNLVLGSIDSPLLVVATGDITLMGAFQFNGMLATLGNLNWTNASGAMSLVNGMVLVGGDMQTAGGVDIVYQQTVADQLRNRIGSFVRVEGGWTDTE